MYADVGDIKRGLSELAKVPDTFPRKNLIEANIRSRNEPFENVIEKYQNAIKQEPDFFLPYQYLISRMEITDPKREFLVNSAIRIMPNSPIAALFWADQELFNKNYTDLARDKWIENLDNFDLSSAKERDIINFSAELPMIMKTVSAIHDLSKLMELAYSGTKSVYSNQPNVDKNHVSIATGIWKILPYLPQVQSEFRCNLSKRLIDCFATYGKPDELEVAHSALCEDCKENIDFEQVLFSSYYVLLKVQKLEPNILGKVLEKAEATAQSIIQNSKVLHSHIVNTILDFYDEWFSPERVLEIAEVIFDLDSDRLEKFDVIEELRLNWNLGIIASRSNNWSLAERFISQALSIELTDTQEKPTQRYEITEYQLRQRTLNDYLKIRSYGEANLAVAFLGQRKFAQANSILKKLISAEYKHLPTQHLVTELADMIDWANEKSDFSNFKNEFRAKLANTSFSIFYGERPKIKTVEYSLSDAITRINSDKISDQIRVHDAISHFSFLESEDLSEIYNSIEADLPNFRLLPENARNSLISAEALRFKANSIFDSAPAIMSYCKSFEISLRELIFKKFIMEMRISYDLDDVIYEAKQDKKYSQFRSFVSYIMSDYLEIGSASQCIKLSLGKTGQRVTLLREFCEFLKKMHPTLVSDENIKTMEDLSLGYRNPAVHEKNFEAQDLEDVRVKCFSILECITSLRLVHGEN